MIEKVEFNNQPLCYIIRQEFQPDKTTFVTPPEFKLQLGFIVHEGGHEISRHVHHPIERNISGTSEILIVQKGSCEVDIYNNDRELIETKTLRAGDIMMMVDGGHGFRMLEDTRLLEIKQGPYPGIEEKERF